jgi:ATP-dependent protease ClpP protease subunit
MAKKELYLYSNVYSFIAEALISQMEEFKDSEIKMRMNTNGGDPQAAFGVIAKMVERRKAGQITTIMVDGKAYSSGSFMLPFADKVEALSVSDFIIHRAAYPSYYEPTNEEKAALVKLNKDLRAALEIKVDALKFAAISGVTLDNVFDDSQRIDVRLTAQQAKEIGLVDEIIDINDSSIAAAFGTAIIFEALPTTTAQNKIEIQKQTTMKKEELQSKFPDLYAATIQEGIAAENERVKSWMVFNDVDTKAVAEGIASGKSISPSEMTELTRKSVSAELLGKLKTESPNPVTPEGADKTEKEKQMAAFVAEVEKEGIKL